MTLKKATLSQPSIRPFLKWAGGKFRISDKIRRSLPKGKRLIEPFVGSAAVFLNTDFERYTLNDINPDLINLFKWLKRDKNEFIAFCKTFFTEKTNDKSVFLNYREEFNQSKDEHLKAALFVYLNRHAFNGLVRYNQGGEFNTSFGSYTKPYFPEQEMKRFTEKVHRAKFVCQDFAKIMEQAEKGDVVYCDPPYVPLSLTSNFTSYHSGGFDLAKQKQLVALAKKLSSRGIPVIISNHDTEFVQELYSDAKIESFFVQRNISCQGKKRHKTREILAVFQ